MASAPKVRVAPTAHSENLATGQRDVTVGSSGSASVTGSAPDDLSKTPSTSNHNSTKGTKSVDLTDSARTVEAPDAIGTLDASTAHAMTAQEPAHASGALGSWLTRHFPGHEHMALGAACGLAIALLVFAIGFFRTLFVVVLVGGGAVVGQVFDGDRRIVDFIRQMVSERRG